MLRCMLNIIMALLLYTSVSGQVSYDCVRLSADRGIDIMYTSEEASSFRALPAYLLQGSEIILCPAGHKRVSSNDYKKRWAYKWQVKYPNLYIQTAGGLVLEGMNMHGFSASLQYLEHNRLPETEETLIPIASSLAINFFIDHFKCIDTALLAVWDTRIFDDIGGKCAWPFRIILHDSTGSTAYIEHIGGRLRVFTPDVPAMVCGGPDYSRFLTIKYIEDSIASTPAEQDFLYFTRHMERPWDTVYQIIHDRYRHSGSNGAEHVMISRSHADPGMNIFAGSNEYIIIIKEMEFDPSRESLYKTLEF